MSVKISGFTVSRCRTEPGCHSSSSSFSSLAHSHPCVCSCMAKAWSPGTDIFSFPLLAYKQPRCSAPPFSPPLTLPLYVVTSFFLIIRNMVTLAEITLIIIFLKKKCFTETSNRRFMRHF